MESFSFWLSWVFVLVYCLGAHLVLKLLLLLREFAEPFRAQKSNLGANNGSGWEGTQGREALAGVPSSQR